MITGAEPELNSNPYSTALDSSYVYIFCFLVCKVHLSVYFSFNINRKTLRETHCHRDASSDKPARYLTTVSCICLTCQLKLYMLTRQNPMKKDKRKILTCQQLIRVIKILNSSICTLKASRLLTFRS